MGPIKSPEMTLACTFQKPIDVMDVTAPVRGFSVFGKFPIELLLKLVALVPLEQLLKLEASYN